jgi:hypothetical protein
MANEAMANISGSAEATADLTRAIHEEITIAEARGTANKDSMYDEEEDILKLLSRVPDDKLMEVQFRKDLIVRREREINKGIGDADPYLNDFQGKCYFAELMHHYRENKGMELITLEQQGPFLPCLGEKAAEGGWKSCVRKKSDNSGICKTCWKGVSDIPGLQQKVEDTFPSHVVEALAASDAEYHEKWQKRDAKRYEEAWAKRMQKAANDIDRYIEREGARRLIAARLGANKLEEKTKRAELTQNYARIKEIKECKTKVAAAKAATPRMIPKVKAIPVGAAPMAGVTPKGKPAPWRQEGAVKVEQTETEPSWIKSQGGSDSSEENLGEAWAMDEDQKDLGSAQPVDIGRTPLDGPAVAGYPKKMHLLAARIRSRAGPAEASAMPSASTVRPSSFPPDSRGPRQPAHPPRHLGASQQSGSGWGITAIKAKKRGRELTKKEKTDRAKEVAAEAKRIYMLAVPPDTMPGTEDRALNVNMAESLDSSSLISVLKKRGVMKDRLCLVERH